MGEGKGKRKVGKERRRGGGIDREEIRGKGGNKEVGGRSRERRKIGNRDRKEVCNGGRIDISEERNRRGRAKGGGMEGEKERGLR